MDANTKHYAGLLKPTERAPRPIDPRVDIGHVHLKTADLDRIHAFYVGILGFDVVFRMQDALFLSAGGYHHDLGFNTWTSRGGTPPPAGTTGLYHVAIRYPTREALGDALKRLVDAGWPLDGVNDHGTHEALYLTDPDGLPRHLRRGMLDGLAELNQMRFEQTQDPEITTRIRQYEMAYRMQASVPELTDLSDEPDHVFEMYGPDSRRAGSYAANCILARRLAERGVRFIQLFHPDWDHHSRLPSWCTARCRDTDQPSAALIKDLKQRGLLDDTLVLWGGEFGRGVAGQGKWDSPEAGRDHHPRCFTMWMAGGGVKPGITYGATDDFSYNVAENPVHVRDLHATVMHQLGIDHERFTFRAQGLDFRLTGVEPARVVKDILS